MSKIISKTLIPIITIVGFFTCIRLIYVPSTYSIKISSEDSQDLILHKKSYLGFVDQTCILRYHRKDGWTVSHFANQNDEDKLIIKGSRLPAVLFDSFEDDYE